MTIRFPSRNLPFEATPWGRKVEEEMQRIDSSVSGLNGSVNNSDRSQSGQLAVLANQINALLVQTSDLTGRVSESAIDTAFTNYNATGSYNLSDAQIGFRLDRPRRVKLSFDAEAMASLGPSGFNLATCHMSFEVNGSVLPTNQVARGFISASTATGVTFFHSTASSTALITLPAGSNIVVPNLDVTVSGTGAVTMRSKALFVDILDPV